MFNYFIICVYYTVIPPRVNTGVSPDAVDSAARLASAPVGRMERSGMRTKVQLASLVACRPIWKIERWPAAFFLAVLDSFRSLRSALMILDVLVLVDRKYCGLNFKTLFYGS